MKNGRKKNQRSILWLLFCLTYPLRRPRYDSQLQIIERVKKCVQLSAQRGFPCREVWVYVLVYGYMEHGHKLNE